jgi:hypothetical protein
MGIKKLNEESQVDVAAATAARCLVRIKATRQGKLRPAIAACGLKSYRHNLSALKRSPVCAAVKIAKRGSHFVVRAKGRIGCTARSQTCQQEIGIRCFSVCVADGDNFAIGLQEDFVGTLAATAEIEFAEPASPKAMRRWPVSNPG